jgi:hypothetical protein
MNFAYWQKTKQLLAFLMKSEICSSGVIPGEYMAYPIKPEKLRSLVIF